MRITTLLLLFAFFNIAHAADTPRLPCLESLPADHGSPLPISVVAPAYPVAAARARIQGVVSIRVTVAQDGGVIGMCVLHGLNPLMDGAAMTATKEWLFATSKRAEPREAHLTFLYKLEFQGTEVASAGTQYLPPYEIVIRGFTPGIK